MIEPDPAATRNGALTTREMAAAVRRNRGIVAGVTALFLALTAAATFVMAPVYESQATLHIIEQRSGSGLLDEVLPVSLLGMAGLGETEIDTDLGVLRSRRLVDAVVDSLALHVQLRSPDRPRSEILHLVRASEDAVPGTYTLRRNEDGTYSLRSARVRAADGRYTRSGVRVRQIVSPPDRIVVGEPFRMGGMLLTLAPAVGAESIDQIRLRVRPFHQYVRRMREKELRVRRLDRGQLVLLDYRNRDPELASAAVNGLTQRFIEYKSATSTSDSRSRVGVLEEQVAAYDERIRIAEQLLQQFQEQQLIVAPEEQATQQVRRVAELQVTRDAAEVERDALARLLAEIAGSSLEDGESPYRRLATFPSFIANGAIQDLLQALISLEDARAELLVLRTPANADVRALTGRIEELELQLLRLGHNYLDNLDRQIEAAGSGLTRFAAELQRMPAREIEYARLTRERRLLSEVYLALQQRLKEAEVMAAIETATGSARVLDPGLVPDRPIFPNRPVNLALGGVLGLMVGLMIMVARESMSTRIRSRADAEVLEAGLPVLGSIPRIREHSARNGRSGREWVRLRGIGTWRAPDRTAAALVTRETPASRGSDAFRALRTNITFAGGGKAPRLLVVTSALPGEGKSHSAANLAVTLAQQGSRTLLVDGDLRAGSLHALFGVPRSPGLSEVLAGIVATEDSLQAIELDPGGRVLHFLPSGTLPPNPMDLLGSEAVGRLFTDLRARFDSIIVDAPALDPVTDAALLGRLSDATILIIRAGLTEQEALRDAIGQLRRLQAPIGGVVLNEV